MAAKEAKARIKINKLLEESGWRLLESNKGKANVVFENNVKITQSNIDEWGENFEKIKNGFIDFLLLDDKNFPLVVLEAKSEDKNPLIGKEQARNYAKNANCRFIIMSNGDLHYLWDIEHGNPTIITSMPTPESFKQYKNFSPDKRRLIEEDIRIDFIALTQDPNYSTDPQYITPETRDEYFERSGTRIMRDYQVNAVRSIQSAVKTGATRFLFEMATGTGKTLTSAAVIKLFLRTMNARRVLFLVDRLELEDQAQKDMTAYLAKDYKSVIYKERKDDWRSAEIVITTVQSLLFNNKYKKLFSPTDFDLVISDEAHRSIGGNARAVFEYFIGYKLGLTATPKDYLKKANEGEQREFERRLMLDTYRTFGCETGEPTFRYSLLDGVRDGFLINPIVVDARTSITTQLLSDKGYAVIEDSENEEGEEIFIGRDFEKSFFSDSTNRIFCETFMTNALRDPISGEIGKTIVFAVSQNHASKITQTLNEIAHRMFSGKYNSDFAMQVTSLIPDAKTMTINFRNNKLGGYSRFNEINRTSKTRVCVTVGMMTTGYDCSDILNLCLMRPVFSPTDFVQIKGRGTRTYNFSKTIIGDKELKAQFKGCKKDRFKLFDFFANCEYFEEKFNYDEVLKLPKPSANPASPLDKLSQGIDAYEHTGGDNVALLTETKIGIDGMLIDRMYFKRFKEEIKENEFIKEAVEAEKWDEAANYVRKEIFDKPTEYINLDKIKKSLSIDRRITVREVLEYIFGLIPRIKMKNELLEDEFERFIDDNKSRFEEDVDIVSMRYYFKAYICDRKVKEAIDNKDYGELNFLPSFTMADYKAVPNGWKQWIPDYINNYILPNRFTP